MSHIKPRIKCADGVSLSVQASDYHYCTPRENADWHSHLEVGYIEDESGEKLAPPESWREHGDGEFPSSVYGYVPIEKVEAFVESHGGAVSENIK